MLWPSGPRVTPAEGGRGVQADEGVDPAPGVVLVAARPAELRAFLRRGLEANGHLVAEADDPASALARVRTRCPDAALLDVGLAGGAHDRPDLPALVGALREGEGRDLPVVLLGPS